jgi:hypothetical protein
MVSLRENVFFPPIWFSKCFLVAFEKLPLTHASHWFDMRILSYDLFHGGDFPFVGGGFESFQSFLKL